MLNHFELLSKKISELGLRAEHKSNNAALAELLNSPAVSSAIGNCQVVINGVGFEGVAHQGFLKEKSPVDILVKNFAVGGDYNQFEDVARAAVANAVFRKINRKESYEQRKRFLGLVNFFEESVELVPSEGNDRLIYSVKFKVPSFFESLALEEANEIGIEIQYSGKKVVELAKIEVEGCVELKIKLDAQDLLKKANVVIQSEKSDLDNTGQVIEETSPVLPIKKDLNRIYLIKSKLTFHGVTSLTKTNNFKLARRLVLIRENGFELLLAKDVIDGISFDDETKPVKFDFEVRLHPKDVSTLRDKFLIYAGASKKANDYNFISLCSKFSEAESGNKKPTLLGLGDCDAILKAYPKQKYREVFFMLKDTKNDGFYFERLFKLKKELEKLDSVASMLSDFQVKEAFEYIYNNGLDLENNYISTALASNLAPKGQKSDFNAVDELDVVLTELSVSGSRPKKITAAKSEPKKVVVSKVKTELLGSKSDEALTKKDSGKQTNANELFAYLDEKTLSPKSESKAEFKNIQAKQVGSVVSKAEFKGFSRELRLVSLSDFGDFLEEINNKFEFEFVKFLNSEMLSFIKTKLLNRDLVVDEKFVSKEKEIPLAYVENAAQADFGYKAIDDFSKAIESINQEDVKTFVIARVSGLRSHKDFILKLNKKAEEDAEMLVVVQIKSKGF